MVSLLVVAWVQSLRRMVESGVGSLNLPNFEFGELTVGKSEFVKLFPRLFNLKK